jgi:hypothetical protein
MSFRAGQRTAGSRWALLERFLLLTAALLLSSCSLELTPVSPTPTVHPGPTPFDTGNPKVNQSRANFTGVCDSAGPASASCQNAELGGLVDAHVVEGLVAPQWPATFWLLPYDQQLFILADQERVDRNLPPVLGITAQADQDALPGALHDRDPVGRDHGHPPILDWASNWASDYGTMAAEFDWMYNDGVSTAKNQGNLDCPRASATGCWGHRQNTLTQFRNATSRTALVFGGTCVVDHEYKTNLSCSEIFELDAHPPRHFRFTWRQAVEMGA